MIISLDKFVLGNLNLDLLVQEKDVSLPFLQQTI